MNIIRRTFLTTTAAASCALGAPTGKGDKLRIAMIGSGGRGGANLNGVKGEEIVALCDVNRKVLEGLKGKYPAALQTTDWREVVTSEKVDAQPHRGPTCASVR